MVAATPGRGSLALALGLVYVIWGSGYFVIRLVIDDAPPLGSMGARFLLAGALMALVLPARGRSLRLAWRELVGAAFLGILLLACVNGMTSVGQLIGVTSGVTALLVAMVPLWICIYRTMSGSRPRNLELVGVGIGLIGLAVLVLPGSGDSDGVGTPVLGVAVVLLSSLCWSFGSWIKPRVWLPGDVLVSATYQLLAAGALMMSASVVVGERLSGGISVRAWVAFGYLVVFGSIVGFTAYAWLLNHAPLPLVATHAYVNPVVAVALGTTFLAEPITFGVVLGGTLVLISVALVVGAQRQQPGGAPNESSTEESEALD